MKTRLLFLIAFAICASSYVQAQDDTIARVQKGPRILLKKVKDSIFIMSGRGGNIGLMIGQDGGLMIDSQFANASERIVKSYQTTTDAPIKFLINTHHHGDHTGGNENFKAMGVTIVSHKNVRQHLMDEARAAILKERDEAFEKRVEEIRETGGERTAADLTAKEEMMDEAPVELKDVFPAVTIDSPLTMHFNGEEIQLIPLGNGHTDGDIVVWFKNSNVIHTGDAYIKKRYPYIDYENGGSVEGYLVGLKKIYDLIDDETMIIPGHGTLANKADVDETIRMYTFLKDRVAYHALSGKSLEEVQAMKDITKPYDDKGFGDYFITTDGFIEALYKAPAIKYGKMKKK